MKSNKQRRAEILEGVESKRVSKKPL